MELDKCPKCGFAIGSPSPECPKCGILFAKFAPERKKLYASEVVVSTESLSEQGSVEKIDGGLQARSGRDLTAGRVLDPDS